MSKRKKEYAIDVLKREIEENATCKKNLQLTRSDIERMVKFEWHKDEEDERLERLSISNNVYFEASGVFGSCRMVVSENDREYDSMSIVSDGTMDAEKQRQNAQVFLVDFICSALGVEAEK